MVVVVVVVVVCVCVCVCVCVTCVCDMCVCVCVCVCVWHVRVCVWTETETLTDAVVHVELADERQTCDTGLTKWRTDKTQQPDPVQLDPPQTGPSEGQERANKQWSACPASLAVYFFFFPWMPTIMLMIILAL